MQESVQTSKEIKVGERCRRIKRWRTMHECHTMEIPVPRSRKLNYITVKKLN